MARRRQIYLVKPADPTKRMGGSLVPLGTFKDVVHRLSGYNTAPDGAGPSGMGEAPGMAFLYGPGYTLEMPTSAPDVTQAIITLIDEDLAWPVLGRLCKAEGWKMMDPESGRMFG